jgi:hypothetical protein
VPEVNQRCLHFGLNLGLKPENLTNFETVSQLVSQHTGDHDKVTYVNSAWFDSDIVRRAPPHSGVRLAFFLLVKLPRTEFHLITARPPENLLATQLWLRQYVPWFDQTRLHIRTSQEMAATPQGGKYKADLATQLGLQWFVEDSVPIYRAVSGVGVPTTLIAQPWNSLDVSVAHLRQPCTFTTILANGLVHYRNSPAFFNCL